MSNERISRGSSTLRHGIRLALVALSLACAGAPGAAAQAADYSGINGVNLADLHRCTDTLAAANLTRVTVFEVPLVEDTASGIRYQANVIARRISAAVRATLGSTTEAPPAADSLGIWLRTGIDLPFVFVLHREGPWSWRFDAAADTVDPKISRAYARALRAMPPDSQWMVWPNGYAPDSAAFHLVLMGAQTQLVPAPNAFTVYSTNGVFEKQVLLKENQAAPQYPEDAAKHHIVGAVMLQFVVDSTGSADTSTIKVLQPTAEKLSTSPFAHYYEEFVQSAKEAVHNDQFYPGHIGACTVRELVTYPFDFGGQLP